MHKLDKLRKEYSKASLDISNVLTNPIDQFNKWFAEAMEAEALEPNAMSLATVGNEHRPSCRIVLLKGIEDDRFLFFTNYQSHKGKDLENNPVCALTFFWPEVERQVRIEGNVTRVDDRKSEEYFQSRPIGAQIGAWSSPQSSVISGREILEERVKQMEKKFEGQSHFTQTSSMGWFSG